LVAVSSCTPQWLEAVISSYAKDPAAAELITKLFLHPDSVPNFSLKAGVLRHKNRV
jgi:hypothetical protein